MSVISDQRRLVLAAVVIAAALVLGSFSGARAQRDTTLGTQRAPAVEGLRGQPDPPIDTLAWNRANGPREDLRDYDLVWADEFDTRSITAGDQSGAVRWFAGAQGGPYGAAAVGTGPRTDVYLVADGVLTIRAHAYTDARGARTGQWYSGHLQTVNTKGEGFAIQEGYFEARMKFPSSMGAWPAFWLKHKSKWLDPKVTNVEFDVVEWYAGDWYGHHHTVHIGDGPTRRYWSDYERVTDTGGRLVNLSDDWHTYGALVTRDWFIVYLDRLEIGRFPMVEVLRTPLYPQLTLSILKEPTTGVVSPAAVSPMDLQVDYVRVYSPRVARPR
jgi:beta-glucanase (GH16 family)